MLLIKENTMKFHQDQMIKLNDIQEWKVFQKQIDNLYIAIEESLKNIKLRKTT